MNLIGKLPRSITRLASIPLAILAGTLVMGIGSSHVYADDAQNQAGSSKPSSGLSLNLLSRDADGSLDLTPSISVSTPLLDVEVPSIQTNASTGKLSVSELKVDTPLGSAGTSQIGIDAKQGTVDLPSVQADTPVIQADVSSSQVDLQGGTASLPGIKAEVPEVIQAETSAVQTDLRQGKVKLPSVKVDVPEVTSVDVRVSGVDLSEGKVQLPKVKANVPATGVSTEVDSGKGKIELPVVKPEQPVDTSDQPSKAVDLPSSQGKLSGQNTAQDEIQVTGQVMDREINPDSVTEPAVSQAVPVKQDGLKQRAKETNSNVSLLDNEWLGMNPSFGKSTAEKQGQGNLNADQAIPEKQDEASVPWQPRAERPANWSVMAIAPSATSTSTGTSTGSSGVTGGGASVPAVALPLALTSPVMPGYGFAFKMERLDGFSQWSQAPPGQPPKYTSFS
ncbi:hypothetical protein Q9R46_23485 [Paenibacillus sp. RRE4]|uniref:hypothetical protein n=1 Tax=Paenibacillus sp. RRE4 TaxID=2962587 RepID=UPI00288291CC|nr:hypothetical protein [Paenibacillus sp. RRE4]MDT0125642.1 hypothetical protein [Paenibacillus sp. RRE4]